MKVLGICGQSGAGKTTVLDFFCKLGAQVCDCDKISREIMSAGSDCSREVVECFGKEILTDGKSIDRKALANIVFFDKEKLEMLTEITNRYIKAEIYKRLDEARKNQCFLFVIDAPLLFESGLYTDCDITLAVTAERDVRLDRIMKRDGIDKLLAEKRLEAQLS